MGLLYERLSILIITEAKQHRLKNTGKEQLKPCLHRAIFANQHFPICCEREREKEE